MTVSDEGYTVREDDQGYYVTDIDGNFLFPINEYGEAEFESPQS